MKKSIPEMYGFRIVDGHRHAYRAVMPPLSYRNDMTATDMIEVERYREKLYTIEITESELDRMTRDLTHFHEYCSDPGDYREMREREHWVRRHNPAVKKAWENYRMLLRLTAEGRILD